ARRGARARVPRPDPARGFRAARARDAEEARAAAREYLGGGPRGALLRGDPQRARERRRLMSQWWVGLSRRERIAVIAAAALVAEKNIAGGSIREGDDQRLLLTVRRADAASWFAWLQEASTELPLRVASARISRVGPGLVDAEVALAPVAQK